ncbi:MAG: hypothetical protein WCC59_02895 [Terriglobales bacterium]
MTAHLNDEQLAQWTLGDHDPEAVQHLAQCDACRTSIDALDSSISDYRDAIASETDREPIFWIQQARAIHDRLRARRFTPVLRWAYAATMVLVLCAAFLVTQMPRPQQQVVTSNSADDVLLQQVENDAAREYPIALAPAALLAEERDGALARGATSSINNATHKEQDR